MILDSPIFTEMILPFLLVFVILFAILQKSKILGDGKAQMDALVSLVVALILIIFEVPRNIIINLMPWLAVGVIVIFIFLVMYSMTGGDLNHLWVKLVFGVLAGIFVIGLILYYTNLGEVVSGWFSGSETWTNIILIIIIGGALAVAIATGKKSGGNNKDK